MWPMSRSRTEPRSPNGARLADLELVLIDDARNARRYYSLTVRRSLFDHVLVIRRGRLGGRLVEVVETFDDDRALVRRYDELAAKRRRHGYVFAG